MSIKNVMRVLAGTAGVLLVAGAAGPGAAALVTEDSGDVQAVVRKTVRQAATATGEITNSTMYTQISAVGSGTKTVRVPVGSTSNRNLNEFGPFPMEGESMVVDLTVADGGGTEQRTVTDADIAPMEVSVKVMLDGAEIAPEDVVGASGVLDVEYTVRNTTGRTEPVTFADVEGEEVTEDIEVADPFVGSLDVVLPQGFNEVTAPGATVAGNGQNETQLGYTFVLFPPLGSTEVKVAYQSRISNGQMPAAEFSFLPIIPFENSTIAGTTEAYKGGAATGAAIFGAGTQIGDNLLKLQEGAGKLVAGLGQLSAGASQLNTGLDSAASGSQELADGSAQLSDGLNELDSNVPALASGVKKLDAGANQLNEGAGDLAAGNAALRDAIYKLSAGVQKLPEDVKAQVEANPKYKQLIGTLGAIITGIGNPSDQTAATLLGGLNLIQGGLRYPAPPTDCQLALQGADPTKCGVADANEFISGQLNGAIPGLKELGEGFRLAAAGNGTAQAPGFCNLIPDATAKGLCLGTFDTLSKCIDGSPTCDPDGPGPKPAQATILVQTQAAANALAKIVVSIDTKLVPGVKGVKGALYNPADGSQCDPSAQPGTAKSCGIAQALTIIKAGIPALVDEITASIRASLLGNSTTAGIGTVPPSSSCDPKLSLTCASTALAAGAAALAGGTETLAEGTDQLNSSVPTLAAGVNQLAAGGEQLAAGNEQLATGLTSAADGSGQLADGLAQAEPGGAQIEDGAGRLKEEGADELAKTGKEAQVGYARNVALLEAAQQAGLEGAGIPFGPAEGTDVTTTAAYKMYVAGVAADTENNALKFGLGALLIAGAGGAAFAGARKAAA